MRAPESIGDAFGAVQDESLRAERAAEDIVEGERLPGWSCGRSAKSAQAARRLAVSVRLRAAGKAMRRAVRRGSRLAGKESYMDISDHRLQARLMEKLRQRRGFRLQLRLVTIGPDKCTRESTGRQGFRLRLCSAIPQSPANASKKLRRAVKFALATEFCNP